MNGDSQAMEQEGMSADSSMQPSAEEGNRGHACCEVSEQGGHNTEDCPLVLAAQECDTVPEAEEADWQVVAGKASKAQANSNKSSKAGKGTKRGSGKKDNKGIKEQGKEEKTDDAETVVLLATPPLGALARLAALDALGLGLAGLGGLASHDLPVSLLSLRWYITLLGCQDQRVVLCVVTTLLTHLAVGVHTVGLLRRGLHGTVC